MTNHYPIIKHIFCCMVIATLFLIQPCRQLSAQTLYNFNSNDELHKKYIELRQSLVLDFMLGVGPDQGYSIPAWRMMKEKKIWWGDAPMHLGYYLGLLAMEYKLLSDNQLPTDQTVKEIYYALNAIDRIDFYAESYFHIPGTTTPGTPSLNGFLIRDDISNVTQSQLDALNTNPDLLAITGWKSDYHDKLTSALTSGQDNVMSSDHCVYLCTGLALAIKFLPSGLQYFENGVPKSLPAFAGATQYSPTLHGEAKNILNRIVEYLHTDPWNWQFENPVTNEDIGLGGDAFETSWGFHKVRQMWTGTSTPNSGSNPAVVAQTLFYSLFLPPVASLSNDQKRMWLNLAAASNCLNVTLVNNSVSTTYNTNQILLNTYMDDNGPYDFDYIPSLNYLLFQDFYDAGGGSVTFDKQQHASMLFGLLSQLNCLGGPHDYTNDPAHWGQPSTVPPGYGSYEWSSCGRLIEPQGRGRADMSHHSFGDFNGIDWMFFYNLYCLLQSSNPQYKSFQITERISPTIAVGQTKNITAPQNTYCFLPLEVEGTFVINAMPGNIHPSIIFAGKQCEVSPNSLIIHSGGKVQLGSPQNSQSGYLQIDNSAALIVKSGSILEVDQNSLVSLLSGSLFIVENGATIHLKGSGKIEIHDDANICIDPGAIIILDNTGNTIEIYDYAVVGGEAQALCPTCTCALPLELTTTGNGTLVFDCSMFMHFSLDPIAITGTNVVWSNVHHFVDEQFTIAPGATLTIVNSTLEFTGDGAIFVDRGGKLIVDNTVLTNNALCPQAFWKGIEVAGNYEEPQTNYSEQGFVEIRNNSSIHRAVCGVTTNNTSYSRLQSIRAENRNAGGIVKIKDSEFINNITAVEILPYIYKNPTTGICAPNVTEIRYTVFKTDDPSIVPKSFIMLKDVHGVKILGNQFINSVDLSGSYFTPNRGIGINLYRASAFVQDYGHGPALPGEGYLYNEPNLFDGLYYGIYRKNGPRLGGTSSTHFPRPIKIDHCQFQNCFRSVYLWCGIGDVVTRNSFLVPAANMLSGEYPYGLYLNYSKEYWVEKNDFNMGMSSPFGPEKGNFGIIVNNSFEDHNELYNNIFDGIQFGINAQNNNRSLPLANVTKGLQVKCNDFSECLNDVVVTSNQTGPVGIGQFQGFNSDPQAPAGNTFSFAGTNIWSDFNNYGVTNNPGAGVYFPNTYYHHSVDPTHFCDPDYNWRPCYFDAQTTYPNNTLFGFDKPYVCPSKIQTGTPIYSAMLASLQGHQQTIASLDATLQIILDGGNTEGLSTRIQFALPWESYQVFGELVAQSPNISQDVMIEAINAVDLFPATMVKSLMLLNPHNIQSAEVMEALYNRSTPLPEYMLYEIMNAGDDPNPVNSLKAELAYLSRNYADTVHQIRRHYLLDTSDVDNNALLLSLGQQLIDVSSGWDRALFLFETSGIDSAIAALQKVENDFMLTDAENIIQQEYYDLMAISQWCTEHTDSLFLVDPQWLNYLGEVAASRHHFSAAMAISLLENLNPEYQFNEEILIPSNTTLRKLQVIDKERSMLSLFPNPAIDHLNVEYKVDAISSSLQIMDATGRVVLSRELSGKKGDCLIDIRQLQSGIYILQILQTGTILTTTRFIKAD